MYRILILEDVRADAELAERQLRDHEIPFVSKRVASPEAFVAELQDFDPDLILADFRLPGWDGAKALQIVRERAPQVPVVMYTGSVNEETAVACLKAGAADYVLKGHPARLGPAVRAALEARAEREAKARAEEALRRSERDYRTLVENAPHGIYRSTPDGRFISVNPALVQMLGYDDAEGVLALDLTRDLYAAHDERSTLIRELSKENSIETVETEWKVKGGGTIIVRLAGRPVRSGEGEIESFEVFAEDVTERRKLEEQLRQAQKMEAIGQLTGGIAHDFNNEISVIQLNADLITVALDSGRNVDKSDLEAIRASARKATKMIKQLLGFSRQSELRVEPTDLAHVVKESSMVLMSFLPESIDIQITADEPVSHALADVNAFEQILLNLASNARDAMADRGRLRIAVRERGLDEAYCSVHPDTSPGVYTCVEVSDTGEGMDEETKSRVFEPFFTTKELGRGTGLGMAMVFGLMKQQGGLVDIYSEVGLGTTVRLYFPATQEEATARRSEPDPGKVRGGTETILLVEDESALRSTGRRALERAGYTVLTAVDGEQGLEVFNENEGRIDLVVSDVVMPRMGGAELYKALREISDRLRFVLASGYAGGEVANLEEIDDSVPLVHKPWNLGELLTVVRRVLDGESH